MPETKPVFEYTAILGGTGGLGAAIAEIYRKRGEPVIVMGSTLPAKMPIIQDIKDIHIRMDLSDHGKTQEGTEQLRAAIRTPRSASLKRFFWVAGMIIKGGFEELDPRDVLKLVDVNLRNALPVAHAAWKLLLGKDNQGPRSFVVVSSTTGVSPEPNQHEQVYAATKAAQVSFARALGQQKTGSQDVKVSLFCPGGMQTGFWKQNPEMDLKDFLDPAKVAAAIVEDVEAQQIPYYERTIKRGSL